MRSYNARLNTEDGARQRTSHAGLKTANCERLAKTTEETNMSRETINLLEWDAEERRFEADEIAFAEADRRMAHKS